MVPSGLNCKLFIICLKERIRLKGEAMKNICDYGAVGDGKTDCTSAIQQALNEAAVSKEAVKVPEGIFMTATLEIPAFTGLTGNSIWGYRCAGGSVLQLNDPDAECLLDLTKGQSATLHGLSLMGIPDKGRTHGIQVDRDEFRGYGEEDAFKIENCRINSFAGCGLYLNRVWCYSVRHCMISHNNKDGIYQHGWDSFVMDNWLTGNYGAGFAAREPNASCNFIGNRVEWNYGSGVEIWGGDHYVINSNFFDRQGGPGLDLRARGETPASQITVNGNIFYRNGKPDRCSGEEYASSHIRCRQSRGLVISGNVCEGARDDPNSGSLDGASPDYGIVLGHLSSAVVKDNVLDHGFLKELLIDEGGHTGTVILRDNIGTAWKKDHE